MPSPERAGPAAIIAAARALVEEGGLPALTMQGVAERVGVRAPSLYKRFRDRDELIRRVAESVADELGIRLRAAGAAVGDDPAVVLTALARALRDFAREAPEGYRLVFSPLSAAARPSLEVLAGSSAPVLEAAARLAGPEHALEAARTVTAWANGFLLMELGDAFRLGGDVERAYEWGLGRLVAALSPAAPAPR